jgi:hypothetical protein
LSETENVVNEKEHVLALLITEVLGDGEAGKSDTGTSARRLVHLAEDEGDFRFTLEVDDTGFNHFVVQIITLTGSFTDTLTTRHLLSQKPYKQES